MNNPNLHNAHLNGDPFFWKEGHVGVLLLHGLTATPAEVRPLGEALRAAGYTVAAPILPGHGASPKDLNRVKWQDWLNAAELTYQSLQKQCDKIFVGGESTGAIIALILAEQHPDIVGVLEYAPALKLALSRLSMLRMYIAAPFVPWLPKPGLKTNNVPLWQGYRVNPLKGVIQLFKLQKVARQILPKINQPILVIEGENDQTIDLDSGRIICENTQSSYTELHILAKSSHVVIVDIARDEATKLTLKFMEKVLAEAD